MPGGSRKRDFDAINENDSTIDSPPLKRTKQKCTWCERERERNDLCNRCRQKVESRAKKLLEQKIMGDHHVVKDTLEFIRENLPISQMRGLDVLQCLEDLFPAKFLLGIFDKQYKGKKGNDVFSCPDRVLRIVVPDMIPTASCGDMSSMNRDNLKTLVKRRVDVVLSDWQARDLSSFDATLSRPVPSDSSPMNDPSLVFGDEGQMFLRKLALPSWSTQNVASFLESCGIRPQVIMQSLRVSNSLNISGRKFMELSDEDLRIKWQLNDNSAAEILRHRCCYLWCCEQLMASNRKTMPNGIARFPIPLGFHGSSYERLEKELRLFGLRLIAITSSYDPMSLVNKIPHSLRFGIDIIVTQGESHVLPEMILKFGDSHLLPSSALVRHSVHSGPNAPPSTPSPMGMGMSMGMGRMGSMGRGMDTQSVMSSGVGSDYGDGSLMDGSVGMSMPPEVSMNGGYPQPPPTTSMRPQHRALSMMNGFRPQDDNKFLGAADTGMNRSNDFGNSSALSMSPLSGSSISPLSDVGSSRSGLPMGVDMTMNGLPPSGFNMPQLNLDPNQMPYPGMMSRTSMNVSNNNKMNYGNNGGTVATSGSNFHAGQPMGVAPQDFGGSTRFGTFYNHPNDARSNMNFNGMQNQPNYNSGSNASGYPMGTGWDTRESTMPRRAPSFMDSSSSNESLLSSSSSVGLAADGLASNDWQSLMS